MNKTLKNGLIALILAGVTMFIFAVWVNNVEEASPIVCMDCSTNFTWGWPLEAGNGSVGGGWEDSITIDNKLNFALDFSLFLLVYFSLLNFRYSPKNKSKNKKRK